MKLVSIFDRIFVEPMFARSDRGATIFYPYGRLARGYLVPEGREAGIRSRVRAGSLFALLAPSVLIATGPRLIESLGISVSTPQLVFMAVVAFGAMIIGIALALSRMTTGLSPAG